jgi:hypothetical protein
MCENNCFCRCDGSCQSYTATIQFQENEVGPWVQLVKKLSKCEYLELEKKEELYIIMQLWPQKMGLFNGFCITRDNSIKNNGMSANEQG